MKNTARLKIELVALNIDEALIDKCQEFSVEKSVKETDRATYQAMEALVHNLNTMHSCGGANAFSSINYGMDTFLRAEWLLKMFCWHRRQAWRRKHPYSRYIFSV